MKAAGGRLRRGTATTVLAATLACAAPPRAAAAAEDLTSNGGAALASAALSQEVADVAQQDLARLAARLNDPGTTQEARDDAARRLVSRRSPEARQIVADALVNLNPAPQLAAARAFADDPEPDPALVNPLFAILGTNRQLTEAAARALANYKSNAEVTTRLIAFAQRPASSEVTRLVVVREIGSIPDRRAAEFLVGIVRDPAASAAARATAAEALVEMTGLAAYGNDPARWEAWWASNAQKPEPQFRADLLPARASRADRVERRLDSVAAALRTIVNEQYRATPAAARPDLLLKHLRADEPQLRAVGAGIVYDEAREGRPPRADVRDQMRELIGDSDAGVRAAVAEAFATINDAASADALLAQLAQETDGGVRASLARALAPIKDLRAVPVLIAMLDDPSPDAAVAAADAIKSLGQHLRENDAALARRAALALRDALERRTRPGQDAALRETLVGAMAPLRQGELLPLFTGMLAERQGESVEVRRLAITAIGEIADPRSAGVLITPLDDRDQRIRGAAVQALQLNPALAENAEALRDRLDPQREPAPEVRDAAWRALSSIFPQLSKQQLQIWSERLKGSPERRKLVLQALRDQQLRDREEDDLAATRQSLGEVLMQLKDYPRAAEEFRLAMEFKKTQKVSGAVLETLMSDRMKALLAAKDFEAVAAFAGQMTGENAENIPVVSGLIWREAQRLRDAGDFQAALDLIAACRNVTPQLTERVRDALETIEKEINTRKSQQNDATLPSRPKSAETPAADDAPRRAAAAR